ncbi:hypothetical protein I4F81_004708 [Pyropia yezoensis]|uniref:Uncharacterized protein n=1 Tax=Pyropia yezoensis TaxID=2788 RepID=A0ACC3BW61_PYRYE|nr:hypothetical protein I4F81_004708 [Neopyropia yezoensis]
MVMMARGRGGALGAVAAMAAAALALTTAPAVSAACRCVGPPSMLTSYFREGIDSVVIATPQRIVSDAGGSRRTYALLGGPYPVNTTAYKGCPRKLERFTVHGPGSSCAMTLTLGEPVLLFLTATRRVGPCDYTVPVASLTAGDIAFLARRSACGGCAVGFPAPCPGPPCSWSRPCDASGRCENNYCGGCSAEWYRPDGKPQVCSSGGGWGGWYPASTPSPSPTPVRTRPAYLSLGMGGGGLPK